MRLFLLFITAWLFTIASISAAWASPYPPDIDQIVQRGVLRVAMYYQDSPPFYYQNAQGSMDGMDVCLVRGLAKRMGVNIAFDREGKTFDAVIDRLVNHQADLAVSKLSETFSRAMRVRFSTPYLQLRQALLVNRLALVRQYGGQLPDKNFTGRLAVLAGSSYVEKAKIRFNQAEIVEMNNWSTMVSAVVAGSVTAIYRDEVPIGQVALDQPQTGLSLQKVVLNGENDPIVVVAPWDSGNVVGLVNYYLQSLHLNITGENILKNPEAVVKEIREKTGCSQ